MLVSSVGRLLSVPSKVGGGGGRGTGAQEIREQEAGEERVGSRSSKRAGSGEKCEMQIILI